MKFLFLALALSFAGQAHAETANDRAESHLKLARGFAVALAKAQEGRLTHQITSSAHAKQNLALELQSTQNLIVMRELLAQDFRSINDDMDLKHRIGNVIRTVDTITSGRDGVPAPGQSRRGVR